MFIGPWHEMKKKTLNHHLIGDSKPTNIAIDFGELFRQNQGPKTKNQDIQLTAGRHDSVRQAAPRARPYYGHGNAAMSHFRGYVMEPRTAPY